MVSWLVTGSSKSLKLHIGTWWNMNNRRLNTCYIGYIVQSGDWEKRKMSLGAEECAPKWSVLSREIYGGSLFNTASGLLVLEQPGHAEPWSGSPCPPYSSSWPN